MSESEVRALRSAVFGECTESNWANTKDRWMQPENIAWLKEKAAKPLRSEIVNKSDAKNDPV